MTAIAMLPWTHDGNKDYRPQFGSQGLQFVLDLARAHLEKGFTRVLHRKPFGYAECVVGFRHDGTYQMGNQPDWQEATGPYSAADIFAVLEETKAMGFAEVIVYHGLPKWGRVLSGEVRAHEWLAPYADRGFAIGIDQGTAVWGDEDKGAHPFLQSMLVASGEMGVPVYLEPRMTASKTTPIAGTVPAGTITQRSLVDPSLATTEPARLRAEDRLVNGVGFGEWIEVLQPNVDMSDITETDNSRKYVAALLGSMERGRTPCLNPEPINASDLAGVTL
jgi:hypothetical protein